MRSKTSSKKDKKVQLPRGKKKAPLGCPALLSPSLLSQAYLKAFSQAGVPLRPSPLQQSVPREAELFFLLPLLFPPSHLSPPPPPG